MRERAIRFWDGIDDPGWGKREADRIERAMREGASGIKIFKALGLGVRLKDESLLRVDDKRLEPIWRRAGELALGPHLPRPGDALPMDIHGWMLLPHSSGQPQS